MSTNITIGPDVTDVIQDMAQQVFSTMLGIELETGVADTKTSGLSPQAGVVAMVGIAGAVSGNVCIQLPDKLACGFASRFLMAEYTDVDGDVLDAIAEIANMIVGGLKSNLEERFGPMGLSLPTVISADRYVSRTPVMSEHYSLALNCKDEELPGALTIQICLLPERSNNSYLRELAQLHTKFA